MKKRNPNKRMSLKVGMMSLGCDKNLADSERLIRALGECGAHYTDDMNKADIMLVNTCCFIEDAKKESIDGILSLANRKDGKKLIVLGCLSGRYGKELKREMPEIDAVFGVGEDEKIVRYLKEESGGLAESIMVREGRASILSGEVAVPLKIAEGCNRRCAFCVIPSIRGMYKSRKPDEILKEAESYVRGGTKELMLVAQDITGYGKDLGGYRLPELIRDINSIDGDFWMRLLYLYPTGISEDLLKAIHDSEKVVRYLDIPFQHSSQRLLKRMGRGGSGASHISLIKRIREALPGVALRTTLIVGFQGETDEDFGGLLDFVEEARFERLGAFKYSNEEGAPSFGMRGQVSEGVKDSRYNMLMDIQADISHEANRGLIGKNTRALVEHIEGRRATARIYSQAKDVDGVTYVKGKGLRRGEFVEIKVTSASDYDLEAVLI